MGKYTYLLIDLGAFLFPFLLSFDKKVAFYKKWKSVALSIILTAIPFLIWDYFKTEAGVWSFSEDHILGIKLLNLPLEEVLFFIIVPYCVIFIYACIKAYFGEILSKYDSYLKWFMVLLSVLLIITQYNHTYTLVVSCSILIYTLIYTYIEKGGGLLITFLVHLIPFYLMNGLLTNIPVVLYNENEYMGYRTFGVPNEDLLYSYAMLLSFLGVYKWVESRLEGKLKGR